MKTCASASSLLACWPPFHWHRRPKQQLQARRSAVRDDCRLIVCLMIRWAHGSQLLTSAGGAPFNYPPRPAAEFRREAASLYEHSRNTLQREVPYSVSPALLVLILRRRDRQEFGCVSASFWPSVVRAVRKSNSFDPKGVVALSSFRHALNCLLPTTPTRSLLFAHSTMQ